MLEMTIARLYELTILIYALSVLLYFIDFLQHNQKANKTAFWLLAIVWVLQTVFLFLRMLDTGRFPILTLYEGMYFYTWVLITFSLVINRILRVDFIVFFTNVIGFLVLALHTFTPIQHESQVVAQALVSELLIIHITMAILSYGAFSLSFAFSMLYVIQYKLLKEKKWGKRLLRIQDLAKLDHMSYVLNVIGVPMLLLSLILGSIWASVKLSEFQWYDMKVIGSFIVIAAYSYYFYQRLAKGISGKAIANWNIAAFLVVLINFFLFGRLSNFHFWIL
ncbi:inner membrane protein YpjD [Sutcliffiella horikoshii]|uniref:cytochrome C assembly family protein n=1 Tax=Sutcliffiella horikoshii TaxID=79883 RepID=UPI001F1CDF37|nr:cytochrome c biogenesis protein [Sutcliffiella horikoshii]MCG1022162.1 cytochrome C assembly protein [Sutcliffiella horikoshii]